LTEATINLYKAQITENKKLQRQKGSKKLEVSHHFSGNQIGTEVAKKTKIEEFIPITIQQVQNSVKEKHQPSQTHSLRDEIHQKIEDNGIIIKTFTHMLEFGDDKFKISASVASLEEFEAIVYGKIGSNLERKKWKIEYFDPIFNEWVRCDDLKIIPEIGRIRITLQG
jgi:hypothetical protein